MPVYNYLSHRLKDTSTYLIKSDTLSHIVTSQMSSIQAIDAVITFDPAELEEKVFIIRIFIPCVVSASRDSPPSLYRVQVLCL